MPDELACKIEEMTPSEKSELIASLIRRIKWLEIQVMATKGDE